METQLRRESDLAMVPVMMEVGRPLLGVGEKSGSPIRKEEGDWSYALASSLAQSVFSLLSDPVEKARIDSLILTRKWLKEILKERYRPRITDGMLRDSILFVDKLVPAVGKDGKKFDRKVRDEAVIFLFACLSAGAYKMTMGKMKEAQA